MAFVPVQCLDAHGLLETTEYPEPLCLVWALPKARMVSWTISESITPPSLLLQAHAPDQHPPNASVTLARSVFAGCCEPLLVAGPSRHYLCHLCGGARTPTPSCPPVALAHFFTGDGGLTLGETRSAHETIPAKRLPQGGPFQGCSHSITFGLLHLLGPQIAPTVAKKTRQPGRLRHA